MPTSRPRVSASFSFEAVREVPKLVQPMARAIWTAAEPTPPPTAWISTRSPGLSRP